MRLTRCPSRYAAVGWREAHAVQLHRIRPPPLQLFSAVRPVACDDEESAIHMRVSLTVDDQCAVDIGDERQSKDQ
jgi:hypothetical protein